MDLLTAMALAPQQPPNTVVAFTTEALGDIGAKRRKIVDEDGVLTFYCRIDCFCIRGIGKNWGATYFQFERYDPNIHGDGERCQCDGRNHMLSHPHPR